MSLEIRELTATDMVPLLELYTQLHHNPMPEDTTAILPLWEGIIADPNHHVIGGFVEGQLVSSCVVVVVPNLTRGQRPYGLVENVVTDEGHRGRGYAGMVLDFAREIAREQSCYKIMLLTGSKDESTLRFYEKAGYNSQDKTAFIQWL